MSYPVSPHEYPLAPQDPRTILLEMRDLIDKYYPQFPALEEAVHNLRQGIYNSKVQVEETLDRLQITFRLPTRRRLRDALLESGVELHRLEDGLHDAEKALDNRIRLFYQEMDELVSKLKKVKPLGLAELTASMLAAYPTASGQNLANNLRQDLIDIGNQTFARREVVETGQSVAEPVHAPSTVNAPNETTRRQGPARRRPLPNGPSPLKRRRENDIKAGSISFNQVYQDGNAPIKHIIEEHPPGGGRWYIFRCDRHDVSFGHGPMAAATAHLRSEAHGSKRVTRNKVLQNLGFEIQGCDQALADRNNDVAREAFGNESLGLDTTVNQETSEPSPGQLFDDAWLERQEAGRQLLAMKAGMTVPDPGTVYCTYNPKAKEWSAVLVLSTVEELERIGVSSSLKSLGLLEDVPSCYGYNATTKSLEWAQGYRDGEPLEQLRKFPVIYFDGRDFPTKSAVGWVDLQNLLPFDLEVHAQLENYQQVCEFIGGRQVSARRGSAPKKVIPGLKSLTVETWDSPKSPKSDKSTDTVPPTPTSTPTASTSPPLTRLHIKRKIDDVDAEDSDDDGPAAHTLLSEVFELAYGENPEAEGSQDASGEEVFDPISPEATQAS